MHAAAPLAAAPSWLTSSVTLNIVTAVGTLLAGIGAIWVLLVAGPRYRLRYGPLRSHRDGEMWKADIYLASRGRRDITREAFDEDSPIELDIGVRILDLGNIWTSKKATRAVAVRVDGTRLLVGPGLIHRRHDLRFAVTAEAKPRRVTCQESLIDVSVRRQFLTPFVRFIIAGVGAFFAAALAILAYAGIVTALGVNPPAWVFTIFGLISLIGYLLWWGVRFNFPDGGGGAEQTPKTPS